MADASPQFSWNFFGVKVEEFRRPLGKTFEEPQESPPDYEVTLKEAETERHKANAR